MKTAIQVLVLSAAAAVAGSQPQWVEMGGLTRLYRRSETALAHDSARGRTVLFGGRLDHTRFSDTWEWDGTTWSRRFPVTAPPARAQHAMAFDAVRLRTVLFGGWDGLRERADTWEWDGSGWVPRQPAVSPPPRRAHAMVFDKARGRVLLFGGLGPAGDLGDTWEWDGAIWTERFPATRPPARGFLAMAYDSVRHRVTLFGGQRGCTPYRCDNLADTWEWDGTSWMQRSPLNAPPARLSHAMAHDRARGRTILFGGVDGATYAPLGDTWEWNGEDWTPANHSFAPQARSFPAMTYDARTERTLLFGGYDHAVQVAFSDTWEWDGLAWVRRFRSTTPWAGQALYDSRRGRVVVHDGMHVWEWDGTHWTPHDSITRPSPRHGHALAYDGRRGRIVLFGGHDGIRILSDTWEWDGTNWARLAPAVAPPARLCSAMSFDARRGRTVLFGGEIGLWLADTWEWDGTTWAQRAPATSPPARGRHSMVFDEARGVTVLFGGYGAASFGDTWEWDGTTWRERLPANAPAPRTWHSLAYDPVRGRTVLFGGWLGMGDTWEWDGTDWSERFTVRAPSPRSGAALAFDVARGRAVLFSGHTPETFHLETWEYSAACDVAGPGHPGGGLLVSCETAPRLGTAFCVTFSDPPPIGAGQALLLSGPAPPLRPPIAVSPPGPCAPAFLHLLPQVVLRAVGDPARFCLVLPANPALQGLGFTLQGAALETGPCHRATDALVVTLQG